MTLLHSTHDPAPVHTGLEMSHGAGTKWDPSLAHVSRPPAPHFDVPGWHTKHADGVPPQPF